MSYYLYKFLKLYVAQTKNCLNNELVLLNLLLKQQVLLKVFLKV